MSLDELVPFYKLNEWHPGGSTCSVHAARLMCPDALIVLQGDKKQHGSVERGATLRVLEEFAGLPVAESETSAANAAATRKPWPRSPRVTFWWV